MKKFEDTYRFDKEFLKDESIINRLDNTYSQYSNIFINSI